MSKSILVIDTPENCASCQMCNMNLFDISKSDVQCQLNKNEDISWGKAETEKPDWCPLKEIPKKPDSPPINSESYVAGWNDCIDEILKEV